MKKQKVQVVLYIQNDKGHKEFLLLKMNERRKGFWQNITGGVETNESYEQAALREAQEETALESENIKKFQLMENLTFEFHDQWGNDVTEKIVFCECFQKWEITLDSSEHQASKWEREENITKESVHYPSNYLALFNALKFLFILFIGSTLANEDIDFSTVYELQAREPIPYFTPKKIRNHFLSFAQEEAIKIQRKEILKGDTKRGFLKKNTPVIYIFTDTRFYLTKDIVVEAYIQTDFEDYYLLKDDAGEVVYKVAKKYFHPINEVTDLYEKPHYYSKIIPKIVEAHLEDKTFSFSSQIHLHLGQTKPNFTRDLINDDDHRWGELIRYQWVTYGKWETFPFQFGLSVNWENIHATLSGSRSYTGDSLEIGPSFKGHLFEYKDLPFSFVFTAHRSFQHSFSYAGPTQSYSYDLVNNSLQLGLETKWKTILIGLNIQRSWLKANAQKYAIDRLTRDSFDDAIALSLGYGVDL